MALMLILGLSLIAASGVLVLRSFALGRTGQRRTLDQIASYGFRTATPAVEESADLRDVLGDLATATGERALARFDGLRAGERGARELLNSAGMYQTTVASFVGLADPGGPRRSCTARLARPHEGPRRPGARRRRCADSAGLALPARAGAASGAAAGRPDRPRGAGARRSARDHGRGWCRLRRGPSARVAQHRGPARPGASPGSARAEPWAEPGRSVAEPVYTRGQPGDASIHTVTRAGGVARCLHRRNPARPGRRHAEAASSSGGGARTEDPDQDPVPADRPDPAGVVHRRRWAP